MSATSCLRYKANAGEVIERLRLLTARQAQDRIFAAFTLPTGAMHDFQAQYSGDFSTEYPDPEKRIRFWDAHLREREMLEDDSIPAAYPSEFDQGLYGGLLGGDVRFLSMPTAGYVSSGWISSMVPPLLDDWSELDKLDLAAARKNVWFERYRLQLSMMRETAEGKFGICHLIVIDSLNFVFELVGATRTYLSMRETPGHVRTAVELAYHLNRTIHDTFFEIVPGVEGGTCSWVLPWLPGRIICESLDPFHMTSGNDLEAWGREPLERLVGDYDGAVLHLHANGWHQLEIACSLRGIKALLLVNELRCPPAIEIAWDLRRRAGDMPLSMVVEYGDFLPALRNHGLPGGVFYYVSGAPGIDAANRCMEQVRAYRV
jgi:hypothetical protein